MSGPENVSIQYRPCMQTRSARKQDKQPQVCLPMKLIFRVPPWVLQAFFADIYIEAKRAKPGAGHQAIAALADARKLQRHYTLNIDGLATAAGMGVWHHQLNPEGWITRLCPSVDQADAYTVAQADEAFNRMLCLLPYASLTFRARSCLRTVAVAVLRRPCFLNMQHSVLQTQAGHFQATLLLPAHASLSESLQSNQRFRAHLTMCTPCIRTYSSSIKQLFWACCFIVDIKPVPSSTTTSLWPVAGGYAWLYQVDLHIFMAL